jgi:O-antigen/teichoic acid export membrane protein
MQQVATASVRQILMLAFPIWLALVALGKPVLALFGPEFSQGYAALAILGTAHLAAASAGIAGYMLIMTGHERATLATFAVVVAAGVALCIALVPRLRLEGAAISTGFALVALAACFAVLCRVRLGVRTVLGRSPDPGVA